MRTEPIARREGGFTLIEVLISIVILAVGLLGVEALGIGAVRMTRKAEMRGQYLAVASDSLETIRSRVVAMAAGSNAAEALRTGNLPDGARVRTAVTAAGANLWRINVTVVPPASSRVLPQGDSIRLSANVFL